MGESNIARLRAAYEAFNRRDWPAIRSYVGEDFEMRSLFGEGRVLTGISAFEELWHEIDEVLEDHRQVIEQHFEAGDNIVAIVQASGIGRESRAPTVQRYATVWTFHEGKIVRGASFSDPEEALASVGLRSGGG